MKTILHTRKNKKGGIMTKARYTITIAITEQESKRLEILKSKRIKTIEIFRKGLEEIEKNAK